MPKYLISFLPKYLTDNKYVHYSGKHTCHHIIAFPDNLRANISLCLCNELNIVCEYFNQDYDNVHNLLGKFGISDPKLF